MSSHKKYIKQLKPITFITFDDNSTWERDSGLLIYNTDVFDESENGDPINGLLHYDEEQTRPSYKLGQPSLIENQITNMYSLVLAPYEYDSTNEFEFSKSWVEIPHVDRIKLDKSFSFSFVFNKRINDRSILGSYIWNAARENYLPANGTNGYNYSSMTRTIFKKGNQVGLYYVMPYSSSDYISVVFPNNNTTILMSSLAGGAYNRDIVVAMTHEYVLDDSGRYYTISRLYWDNRIIYEYTTNPVFGEYNGGNTSSIEIGGNQSTWDFNSLNDRTTTQTKIDQFAVFDYALKDFQVANIYKKIYQYETIIKRSFPTLYYPMNEEHASTYFSDVITGDTYRRLSYFGTSNQVIKQRPGVHGIYGSTMTEFRDRGMLYCKPYNGGYYSYFNPSGDFTIEFFASFTTSTKGMLLSIQDDTAPFRGISLFVNCRNNVEKAGSIQLSISDSEYIQTIEKDVRGVDIVYNDGVIRHYAIIRRGLYIEFWINSVLVDKIYMTSGNLTSDLNQLFMFGLMPGNLAVNGTLQHLAIYTRALSKRDIEIRSSYLVRYEINGRVTVQGIGQTILIRIYSFNSGELILNSYTDSDGNYRISIPSDDYINFVAMDLSNVNIKPYIVGPELPDSYEDIPWE